MPELITAETLGVAFERPDPFAYPLPYTLDDLQHDMGVHAQNRYYQRDPIDFSPWQVIERWWNSSAGIYQRAQVARWGSFHKELVIPRYMKVDQRSQEATDMRLRMLGFLAESAGADLHPIGHSAVYFSLAAQLQEEYSLLHYPPYDNPRNAALSRHTRPTHDFPEVPHPGIVLVHGKALPDFATGQKPPEAKALERQILVTILREMYSDVYPPDFQADMVHMIRHETEHLDPLLRQLYLMNEVAHSLGHRATASAVFDAGIDSEPWMHRVVIGLAHDVERHTTPFLCRARAALPELAEAIDTYAAVLDNQLDCRWSWRQEDGRRMTLRRVRQALAERDARAAAKR